jgi:hypothetical protein
MLSGIPFQKFKYVVLGRTAIEWIMDRYPVTVDKESGIVNDPNDWSEDPRYIIDLAKVIVRVSLETNRFVASLPPLNGRNMAIEFPSMNAFQYLGSSASAANGETLVPGHEIGVGSLVIEPLSIPSD